jgi:hypothetical protein
MATQHKHDTLNEIADELPNHTDTTGQLTSKEPRGFPPQADPLVGYHAAGTVEYDQRPTSGEHEKKAESKPGGEARREGERATKR